MLYSNFELKLNFSPVGSFARKPSFSPLLSCFTDFSNPAEAGEERVGKRSRGVFGFWLWLLFLLVFTLIGSWKTDILGDTQYPFF